MPLRLGITSPPLQICVRGPIVFQGYFKDEANTRDTIDSDGWLHTGGQGATLGERCLAGMRVLRAASAAASCHRIVRRPPAVQPFLRTAVRLPT